MSTPEDLRYSNDHEWARLEGDLVRIGITDYAQDALGDVVYVQLPAVGAAVVARDSIAEVESTKSVSDIFAPLTGTVVAVNDVLMASPDLVNTEPYGSGWLFEIQLTDAAEYEALMTAAQYDAFVAG